MLAYNIYKNEEKIIFETCLATMGAKTKEGGGAHYQRREWEELSYCKYKFNFNQYMF